MVVVTTQQTIKKRLRRRNYGDCIVPTAGRDFKMSVSNSGGNERVNTCPNPNFLEMAATTHLNKYGLLLEHKRLRSNNHNDRVVDVVVVTILINVNVIVVFLIIIIVVVIVIVADVVSSHC